MQKRCPSQLPYSKPPAQQRTLSLPEKFHNSIVRFFAGLISSLISLNKGKSYDARLAQEVEVKVNNADSRGLRNADGIHDADKICFVGSSFFTLWEKMEPMFLPLKVYNHGFGGAQSRHVVEQFEKLVLPFRPKLIVYYCGVNDVNFGDATGQGPETAVENFKKFYGKVQHTLPTTRILYVSCIYSPIQYARNKVAGCVEINREIRKFIDEVNSGANNSMKDSAATRIIDFLDLNCNLDLVNDRTMYKFDLLHYNQKGYEKVLTVFKPKVEEVWSKL